MPLTILSVFKPGTDEELTYNTWGEICQCGPGTMIGYDTPAATAKTIKIHSDGKKWLHTGDIGYMTEDGTVYTLTRGKAPRYGGGDLATLPMENKLADAQIPGIDDEFFVILPDPDHEWCFLPYLFVVLEDGYTVDDIRDQIAASLDDYMQPVQIIARNDRFSTSRRIVLVWQRILKRGNLKNKLNNRKRGVLADGCRHSFLAFKFTNNEDILQAFFIMRMLKCTLRGDKDHEERSANSHL